GILHQRPKKIKNEIRYHASARPPAAAGYPCAGHYTQHPATSSSRHENMVEAGEVQYVGNALSAISFRLVPPVQTSAHRASQSDQEPPHIGVLPAKGRQLSFEGDILLNTL